MPDPRNARFHSERNRDLIRRSLEEVGPGRSILVDGRGVIRAGNGVYEQAAALGIPVRVVDASPGELIAVRRKDLKGARAERAALLDNRAGELATWDAAVLQDLAGRSPEVLDGLFDSGELDAILTGLNGAALPEPGGGGDEFDATPAAAGPTRTAVGEVWVIGGAHRLLVGDCTDAANVERLMGGGVLDLAVTDPPYGVAYADKNRFLNAIAPGNRIQEPILGDHGEASETAERLWKPAFSTLWSAMRAGAAFYVFAPQGGDQMMMMMMMMAAYMPVRHELIWVKNNHVLGRADYAYRHEPILYGWKAGAGHSYYGAFQTSVLEFPRPQKSDLHPTMKPVDLVGRLIENSSLAGDAVGDWFLGSGTTLVAAARLGRRCYGFELEPRYADVILKRAEAEGLSCERAACDP